MHLFERESQLERLNHCLLETAEPSGIQQRVTVLVTLALVRMRRGDPGVNELLDEAFTLALPTCELNRIGRVTAARAEHALYQGATDRVIEETSIGLGQVDGHAAPDWAPVLSHPSCAGVCANWERATCRAVRQKPPAATRQV